MPTACAQGLEGPTVLDRESTLLCSIPFPSRGVWLPEPSLSVDLKVAGLEFEKRRFTETKRHKLTAPIPRCVNKENSRSLSFHLRDKLQHTIVDKAEPLLWCLSCWVRIGKDIIDHMLSDSWDYFRWIARGKKNKKADIKSSEAMTGHQEGKKSFGFTSRCSEVILLFENTQAFVTSCTSQFSVDTTSCNLLKCTS